jgi:type I restriction enzyme, R subunit
MRDHTLLQAIARVNRPYFDANGVQKRVGLVIDFVGVLRELKKALQFDSDDVSGIIEDLDLLLKDFLDKIEKAKTGYLETGPGSEDEKLERVVGRLFDPEQRKLFYEAYKDIEALWEISLPSPELRDHIESYKNLAKLYAAVRNAYAPRVGFVADLAYKAKRLVEESASQERLGVLAETVTFDVKTLEGLRNERGADESKVFNLVRSLHHELEEEPAAALALRPIAQRADQILNGMEERNITGLAAMDYIAALAREKVEVKAADDSGLSACAFGIYWSLKDDQALANAGIPVVELAKEGETVLARFPTAQVNENERRRLRAALYRPLLGVNREERGRIVEALLTIPLDGGSDANA